MNFTEAAALILTDIILPVCLLTSGIYLTVKSRFIQGRGLLCGLKNTLTGLFSRDRADGISPFAALSAALAAQLGTGNIVGAGAAVMTGGAGAVFWMWLSAFFGMATAFYEAYFAQKTKQHIKNGAVTGGAAYYIKSAYKGRAGKYSAVLFSFFSLVALGLTGSAVQANSIASSLKEAINMPSAVTGMLLVIFAFLVLGGGTESAVRLSEKAIPVMAVLYTLICVSVIIINIKYLPLAVAGIFRCAFSPAALRGGLNGVAVKTAITQGVKRGLFTNEAGMGSAASMHALSDAPSAYYQGTLGIAGVFIDTFLMLSVTALAVITGILSGAVPQSDMLSGSEAVSMSFSVIFGKSGAGIFVALCILLFAFASIIGWNLSGKSSCIYLFGEKSTGLYKYASLFFIFLGCCIPGKTAWLLTDIFNAFMVLTNVPALMRLAHKNDIIR